MNRFTDFYEALRERLMSHVGGGKGNEE